MLDALGGASLSSGVRRFLAHTEMPPCHLEPDDKRAFVGAVGEELVRRHGKQHYYKPADIRRAAESRGYPVDIYCWAYCIFSTPDDFRTLHDTVGEVCDYAAMKAEVLSDLATGGTFSWIDIDLSALQKN